MSDARVSITIVRTILRYLEAHGGVPEDFFSGLPVQASHYEGGEAWISYDDFKTLFHRVQWVTGEEDIAYKIGAWTVRYRSLGIFGFLSRLSRSPATVIRRAPSHAASLGNLASHNVVSVDRHGACVEHRYHAGIVPTRALCSLIKGGLTSLPTLWGRMPASLVEPRCAVPIDQLGPIFGRAFTVERGGRVWQHAIDGSAPPQEIGRLAGDGTFQFGDTVYGAEACVHEVHWESSRPWYHWFLEYLFRRPRFALQAFDEYERTRRILKRNYGELERHAAELERQARHIRQSERLYREIFAQNADGIFLLNHRSAAVERVNAAAGRLAQRDEHDLVGQPFMDLFPSKERGRMREVFDKAVETGSSQAEEVNFREPGADPLIVEVRAASVDIGGKLFCQLIMRDITARVTHERERQRFIRNVAHELRTPVAVIKNHGDIMLRYSDMEEQDRSDFLRTIVAECGRLAAMIQDLLFVETVEAGQVILSEDLVDLAALCEHFTSLFRIQAEAKGMALECDVAEDLPKLRGDAVKLGQVIANLFGNAIKFSPPNSRVVCHAEVEGDADAARVRLAVEDEGPGIAAEHREFIFQKYAQIRDGSTEASDGMGLGLAIVREIVELHGGRVWVEGREPVGSRFVVVLPVQPVRREATGHE